MLKKFVLLAAALGTTAAIPAAAEAQSGYYDSRYGQPVYRTDRYGRTYDRYGNRVATNGGYYGGNGVYNGANGGYYGRSSANGYYGNRQCSGTTGTIVGGVAGALLGREIGRSGSRYSYNRNSGTTAAIIGGAVGALAGRAIDKSNCN